MDGELKKHILTFKGCQQVPENQRLKPSSAKLSQRSEVSLTLTDDDIRIFSAGALKDREALFEILYRHHLGTTFRLRLMCSQKVCEAVGSVLGIDDVQELPSVHLDVFPGNIKGCLVKTDIEFNNEAFLELCFKRRQAVLRACSTSLGLQPDLLFRKNQPPASKTDFARCLRG